MSKSRAVDAAPDAPSRDDVGPADTLTLAEAVQEVQRAENVLRAFAKVGAVLRAAAVAEGLQRQAKSDRAGFEADLVRRREELDALSAGWAAKELELHASYASEVAAFQTELDALAGQRLAGSTEVKALQTEIDTARRTLDGLATALAERAAALTAAHEADHQARRGEYEAAHQSRLAALAAEEHAARFRLEAVRAELAATQARVRDLLTAPA